jgi:hypothetical protein
MGESPRCETPTPRWTTSACTTCHPDHRRARQITIFGYTTDATNFSKLTQITRPGSNPTTLTYGDANNPFSPSSVNDSSGPQTTYS